MKPFRAFFQWLYLPLAHVNRGQDAIKFVAFYALVISLSGMPAVALARTPLASGVVTRVVDGDTVWVKAATPAKGVKVGDILKVRIVGIDAPEICQPGGRQALAALRSHVLGQTVTLSSPSSRRIDDYGRVLATLDKQGDDVGRWMVQRGQAWSYGYRQKSGPYAAEQTQAQAGRVGLFAQSAAENPRSFRKRHGSCYP